MTFFDRNFFDVEESAFLQDATYLTKVQFCPYVWEPPCLHMYTCLLRVASKGYRKRKVILIWEHWSQMIQISHFTLALLNWNNTIPSKVYQRLDSSNTLLSQSNKSNNLPWCRSLENTYFCLHIPTPEVFKGPTFPSLASKIQAYVGRWNTLVELLHLRANFYGQFRKYFRFLG